MNRRGFLKALGIGALAAAAPELIEPVRKLWFVPSSAPVGSRVERLELGYDPTWDIVDFGHPNRAVSVEMIDEVVDFGPEQYAEMVSRDHADALQYMYGGMRGGGKTSALQREYERQLRSLPDPLILQRPWSVEEVATVDREDIQLRLEPTPAEERKRLLRGIWARAEREADEMVLRIADSVGVPREHVWEFANGSRFQFGKS